MLLRWTLLLAGSMLAAGCAMTGTKAVATGEIAREQVRAVETAFAKTMADRDLKAFGSYLAEEAVFFSGPLPLHGKQAVIGFWSRFYAQPAAPFSWWPEEVEVLEGGTLALSAGPVFNPQGKLVGRFSSIWRQEAPGQWKIVFDKGSEVCDCEKK